MQLAVLYNNPALMTSGLANYARPTSLATNQGFNVKSGIFNPAALTLDSQNYMGNAGSIGNQLLQSMGGYADTMQNRAFTAGQNFGTQFAKFLSDQSQPGRTTYQYDASGKPDGHKNNNKSWYLL